MKNMNINQRSTPIEHKLVSLFNKLNIRKVLLVFSVITFVPGILWANLVMNESIIMSGLLAFAIVWALGIFILLSLLPIALLIRLVDYVLPLVRKLGRWFLD
jgi:hypothetical protein